MRYILGIRLCSTCCHVSFGLVSVPSLVRAFGARLLFGGLNLRGACLSLHCSELLLASRSIYQGVAIMFFRYFPRDTRGVLEILPRSGEYVWLKFAGCFRRQVRDVSGDCDNGGEDFVLAVVLLATRAFVASFIRAFARIDWPLASVQLAHG